MRSAHHIVRPTTMALALSALGFVVEAPYQRREAKATALTRTPGDTDNVRDSRWSLIRLPGDCPTKRQLQIEAERVKAEQIEKAWATVGHNSDGRLAA